MNMLYHDCEAACRCCCRCAHCKSLEPVMSEVGKRFLQDADFVLYRVDGSKNDIVHPRVRLLGYPTLYFFPGGDKGNPMEYDGNRTVEAIVSFIEAFRAEYHHSREEASEGERAPRDEGIDSNVDNSDAREETTGSGSAGDSSAATEEASTTAATTGTTSSEVQQGAVAVDGVVSE